MQLPRRSTLTLALALAITLALTLALVPSSVRAADDCNCTEYPFSKDPPCRSACLAAFLRAASREDMLHVFHLDMDIVESVDVIRSEDRPRSLQGYSRILYPEQESRFDWALKELPQSSVPKLIERLRATGVDPTKVAAE